MSHRGYTRCSRIKIDTFCAKRIHQSPAQNTVLMVCIMVHCNFMSNIWYMNVHAVMSCTIPKRVEVAHITQTIQSQPKAFTWRGGESLNHARKQKQVCMKTMFLAFGDCGGCGSLCGHYSLTVYIYIFFKKKKENQGALELVKNVHLH